MHSLGKVFYLYEPSSLIKISVKEFNFVYVLNRLMSPDDDGRIFGRVKIISMSLTTERVFLD